MDKRFVKVVFDDEGMGIEARCDTEQYVQAVYTLIEAGFAQFRSLEKLELLGALYKAINSYSDN